jgi:hypothetical protein
VVHSERFRVELTCVAVVSVAYPLEILSTRTSKSEMFCVMVSRLLAASLAVTLAWQLPAYAAAKVRKNLWCMIFEVDVLDGRR